MAKNHPSDRRAEFANDTKTIKNLTAALYEAICFDADRPQDWDRISNLVIPGGRFGFSMGIPFVFLTLLVLAQRFAITYIVRFRFSLLL